MVTKYIKTNFRCSEDFFLYLVLLETQTVFLSREGDFLGVLFGFLVCDRNQGFVTALKILCVTLCIVIDQTPISTFCFIVDLSENHLSYVNK